MKTLCTLHQKYTIKRLMKTVLVLIVVYLFILCIFLQVCLFHKSQRKPESKLSLPFVIVHLDLKGAPPKLSYLMTVLPILKEKGANGLLIEYEDMFPYNGAIKDLSSKKHYKKTEV